MDIKEELSKVKISSAFTEWRPKNGNAYLVHIFKMFDKPNIDECQIGYYDPSSRKITTFTINDKTGDVVMNPESDAFTEDDKHIEKLDIDELEVNLNEAMRKIQPILEKEFSSHPVDKSFTILQRLITGIVWNFTFITRTFQVINIKVDATTGEIVDKKASSVFEFKSG